jgi:hypothetical protein
MTEAEAAPILKSLEEECEWLMKQWDRLHDIKPNRRKKLTDQFLVLMGRSELLLREVRKTVKEG